jgi:hypothetical protein
MQHLTQLLPVEAKETQRSKLSLAFRFRLHLCKYLFEKVILLSRKAMTGIYN